MSKKNEYGTCDVCQQPFQYGNDFIRIEAIRNYQSQGYPDQFCLASFDCHIKCVPSSNIKILEMLRAKREKTAKKDDIEK